MGTTDDPWRAVPAAIDGAFAQNGSMGRWPVVTRFLRSRVLRPVAVGLLAAIVVAALTPLFTPARWPVVILPGLVAGALAALIDVVATRSQESNAARAREALGFDLTPQLRRRALQQPVPADPIERERQRQVVDHLVERVRATRRQTIIVNVLNVLFQVALALLVSPFFWFPAALTGCALIVFARELRRLRRRQAELASALR